MHNNEQQAGIFFISKCAKIYINQDLTKHCRRNSQLTPVSQNIIKKFPTGKSHNHSGCACLRDFDFKYCVVFRD